MAIVEEGYGGDGLILAYHGDRDAQHGDGLAAFIVQELTDNFLPEGDGDQAQRAEALHLMEHSAADIHNVMAARQAALLHSMTNRK